ncbi:hypothetical protein FRC16_008598 [Serendipita sp. 398]|nr:hypothetical protein FRC16_008598 [Serendipita sp. 398]
MSVQSAEFPKNYGDFRLVSSDGVVFSFPRFLLSHMSPVFKDMLEIGTADSMGRDAELRLAEDSTTLDQLLRFLDPAKRPLPIDISTVDRLLESAQKYQIERVFEYWEEQMTVRDASMKVVEIRCPMVTLSLATRFHRRHMLKLALRELIRGPDTNLHSPSNGFLIGPTIIIHATRLRQQRSEKLIGRIREHQKSLAQRHTCCRESEFTFMKGTVIPFILELIKEPSWNTFERHMDCWNGCPVGVKWHLSSSRTVFNDWKASILEEEEELPELPEKF